MIDPAEFNKIIEVVENSNPDASEYASNYAGNKGEYLQEMLINAYERGFEKGWGCALQTVMDEVEEAGAAE